MHTLVPAAASHAVPAGHVTHLGAIVTALIAAAIIIAVLKVIGRLLTRKPKQRPGLPYSASRR
jgi:hypothetical protein